MARLNIGKHIVIRSRAIDVGQSCRNLYIVYGFSDLSKVGTICAIKGYRKV